MRATDLRYRSPKEQTGEFTYPQVLSNGLNVSATSFYPQNKSTFPRSKRWEHIEQVSRRTAYHVGPGCYDYKITTNKGRGALMRPDLAVANGKNREVEYLFVGHVITKRDSTSQYRSHSQPRSANRSSVDYTNREISELGSTNSPMGGTRIKFYQKEAFGKKVAPKDPLKGFERLSFDGYGSLASSRKSPANQMVNRESVTKSFQSAPRHARARSSLTGRLTNRSTILESSPLNVANTPKQASSRSREEIDFLIKKVIPLKVNL